jgi:RimJ/RimL family protein N-acetyltransferase
MEKALHCFRGNGKGQPACLRIVPIDPTHLDPLAFLFNRISKDASAVHFHPHPFNWAEANLRANYAGRDYYALMMLDNKAIGYGFLRGWDDKYAIPSLGIYIDKPFRGSGAAKVLMEFLHLIATLRGASRVRLRVHPDNVRARRLYDLLGYRFSETLEDGEFIGFLDLPSAVHLT